MPESAEVKILSDQLTKEFGQQSLLKVDVVGGRFLKKPIEHIEQLVFPLANTRFNAKGKFMYWTFDSDTIFFITLGMAASFGPQSKHSALKFTFDKGDVYFNDIRHFGTFKISNKIDLDAKLNSLGWDPLHNPKMPQSLPAKLAYVAGHKTIAEALLNQKVFAGVGNYIRSEALYLSGIHPLRKVDTLTQSQINIICNNIIKVVQEAYQSGGATIATFKDMYGNSGKFFDKFKVYSKKQTDDGKPITKITAPDGRSVFFVESQI